jgi:hypothetical protein
LVVASVLPAAAQQRGSITGKVVDAAGLVLPGATVTVTEQATGFNRTVVTEETGAYAMPNLDPGTYTVVVEMSGFSTLKRPDVPLTAGSALTIEFKLEIASVQQEIVVTAQSPLVQVTNNQIGGSLSSQEIEEIPSNFRISPRSHSSCPASRRTPPLRLRRRTGRRQRDAITTERVSDRRMYNNDDRLGGSQGTQVRVVLDNIDEYQVLSNQYSAEFGGGAGAIINMITRGGSNNFNGRAYTYFRDDYFNARGHFLPAGAPKPSERTSQTGFAFGGPIARDRAHFNFTIERDYEEIAGRSDSRHRQRPCERLRRRLHRHATNYFGRGDVQLTPRNIISARWVLETAPTKGEGFNTNIETIDAQQWESDWDHLISGTYTAVVSDRATNVLRLGRIGEQLGTGAQAFFDQDVNQIGFDGRDPFSIGQRNVHPSFITGRGGEGLNTKIRTYVVDESFSYFAPNLAGEHNFKFGAGISFNEMPPRTTFSSGTFQFRTDAAYNPADPATYPFQFDVTVGPPSEWGYEVFSRDRRFYGFAEDKWRLANRFTLNLGLRYDRQKQTPNSTLGHRPRVGFAWGRRRTGNTVIRGGIGKFLRLSARRPRPDTQQNAVQDAVPQHRHQPNHALAPIILRPRRGSPTRRATRRRSA